MSDYENMRTADIVVDALLDWNVNTIFDLPGDRITGFIEALRQRQDKIQFILVMSQLPLWHVLMHSNNFLSNPWLLSK